ncbi:hypothetical protein MSIBF_A3620003 [groundwater metagenome]|uniref:DUF763 domain-containing protein n=1 Tax=groundwater metagenome TaxID=717931 RepID=A0A098ECQ3_9ZZZZ
METGFVDLPLHPGTTPRWLFERMTDLSREISKVIIYVFRRDEFLRILSYPFWFQGFTCAIGFDWHSSGTTSNRNIPIPDTKHRGKFSDYCTLTKSIISTTFIPFWFFG